MAERKFGSFLEKLKDDLSSIVAKGSGGDRASLLEKVARFLKEMGATEEEISSFLEPEEEENNMLVAVTEGIFITLLVLIVLTHLTNNMGMPEWLAFGQRWIYGVYISNMWCNLIYTECPIDLTPKIYLSKYLPIVFICMNLLHHTHEILMELNILFHGRHFVLDFILQGLVLANLYLEDLIRQLCEKSYELCEKLFETLESMLDRCAKLCEIVIEKVLGHHIHVPTILDLSQGQKHFYRCIVLMVCIESWNSSQARGQFAGLGISSITILFWIHFYTIVGNTQLWLGWLTLWQSIKEQLNRHLWQRWLALWEKIKERLCEDYFKMPGGLRPNRYHARYYVGLNRLRFLEYGILIRVLPDLTHEGIRIFSFCGIHVFHGEPVPVPAAPYA